MLPAYKIFSSMLLQRLLGSGADRRLRQNQFGFRAGHSTVQALFLAQRLIDQALASKNGTLSVLLLDWSKAFDRIHAEAMIIALQRFGITGRMLDIVRVIYSDRSFHVKEGDVKSSQHRQSSGIAQGCPLSPYLFIIVLTVLMADVERECAAIHPDRAVWDIEYADDTALMSTNPQHLQATMDSLVTHGARYGLEVNWDKTVALVIGGMDPPIRPDGHLVKCVEQYVYLGGLLTANGSTTTTLLRRLGEAGKGYDKLHKIWGHANITVQRKVQIFEAVVLSKLLCSLEALTFNKAMLQKLDAFQGRCLRRLTRIPHSMISHVTNASVLWKAGAQRLSNRLLERQLRLFGRVACMPASSPLRTVTFEECQALPLERSCPRRRGRPKMTWSKQVHALALRVAGNSQEALDQMLMSPSDLQKWYAQVKAFCASQ